MEQKRTQTTQPVRRAGTSVSVPRPASEKSAPVRKAVPVKMSKRKARRRAVREPKFITVRKERKERKPFPLGIVLVLAMITALFLFMMMNYAEIDQYNGEIRDLQNTLAKLQNEQKPRNKPEYAPNVRLLVKQSVQNALAAARKKD